VALLIDTPRWEWRGHLWAHLISDVSLDELHEAARGLGLRWLSFGRDHYDVPDVLWPDACEIAELVDSRVIVRSLRASGLRVGGGKPQKSWRLLPDVPPEIDRPEARAWRESVVRLLGAPAVDVLGRPTEVVVFHLVEHDSPVDLGALRAPPVPGSRVVETVVDGRYSVELILEWHESAARSTMPIRPER
jgi:hypothetical protein